jgi:hypothetical protein
MEDINVRSLKTKDLFTVADILGQCGEDFLQTAGTVIRKTFMEKEKGTSLMTYQMIGVTLFTSALKQASGAVKTWLADLIGKTVEEFEEMPLGTSLKIVKTLGKQEDLTSFFQEASSLAKELFGEKQTSSKNGTSGQTG